MTAPAIPQTTPVPDINDLDPTGTGFKFEAENAQQYKYGGAGQQILAGLEGAARGISLGTSDIAETKLLSQYNPDLFGPEAVAGRQEANPVTAFAGNILGTGALLAGTAGGATPAEAGSLAAQQAVKYTIAQQADKYLASKGLNTVLSSALAHGAEGAVLSGVSGTASDYALGDPDLNAQKIASHIGWGAGLGAGLGALSKSVGLARALTKSNPQIEAQAIENSTPVETPFTDTVSNEQPRSLAEMKQTIEDSKKYGGLADITASPKLAAARASAEALNSKMDFPFSDMQINSLTSPEAELDYKNTVELPGPAGDTLRDWHRAQKTDLVNLLDNNIKGVSGDPQYVPTSDAQIGGGNAADRLTSFNDATEARLGPAFEAIQNTDVGNANHLPGVLDYLTNKDSSPRAMPELAEIFDHTGDEVKLKPYNGNMPVSKVTYNKVSSLVQDLKDDPTNFQGIKNLRETMGDGIDPLSEKRAPVEITQLKAALMDYIQDTVKQVNPDLEVRQTMQDWAKNVQNRQLLRKAVGVEIGDDWRAKTSQPESKVLNKIFNNPDLVDLTKSMMSPEDWKKTVADYLANIKGENTSDLGEFKSKTFANKMRTVQYSMNNALLDNNPGALAEIKHITNGMSLFADDVGPNPPHTARTLLAAIAKSGFGLHPLEFIKNVGELAYDRYKASSLESKINAQLAGQADQVTRFSAVQGILDKVSKKIEEGTSEVMRGAAQGAAIGAGSQLTKEKFDNLRKKLGEYSSNPQSMANETADNSQHLYQAAPNITQSLHTSLFNGVQFLNSKMPQPPVQMPLSAPWEPSYNQMSKFNQYYQAVNDPVGILRNVKNGSLTNEAMEALQATSPKLLAEMQSKVLQKMDPEKMRNLPYSQKLSIGKFLNQPLDENMVPAAILSNQMAMNAPQMSQQISGAVRPSQKGLEHLAKSGRTDTMGRRSTEEEA